jgi:hypothetical protein
MTGRGLSFHRVRAAALNAWSGPPRESCGQPTLCSQTTGVVSLA